MSLVRDGQLPVFLAAGGAALVFGIAFRRRSWSTWLAGIALLVLALVVAWGVRPAGGSAA
jgi:membrane protein implicated in regulation of membrane protease activity